MYLVKIEEDFQRPTISTEIEKFGINLLMIKINFKRSCVRNNVPSYWRFITNEQIPPLEIGINRKEQNICNITLFLEKIISEKPNLKIAKEIKSDFRIETSLFPSDYYFIDNTGKMTCYLHDHKFWCFFFRYSENEVITVNQHTLGKIVFYFDMLNQLLGFGIDTLSSFEYCLIKSIVR